MKGQLTQMEGAPCEAEWNNHPRPEADRIASVQLLEMTQDPKIGKGEWASHEGSVCLRVQGRGKSWPVLWLLL